MYLVDGLSQRQIAQKLDISSNTVTTSIAKATPIQTPLYPFRTRPFHTVLHTILLLFHQTPFVCPLDSLFCSNHI
ncbi:MAG: sigma factor-like helix-turn-helix DNA-binding protein [Phocaeicola sp.]|uniref:sigma factor-like helix-turn-helix DNA-binding protein n=1 Tax=Phocaeicola sp. TaxID=2773926 RepID=UPI003F9EFB5D